MAGYSDLWSWSIANMIWMVYGGRRKDGEALRRIQGDRARAIH